MSSRERAQHVAEIVKSALERTPDDDVSKFLDQACAGDAEIRREVDSLLKFQTAASGFIEQSAMDLAAETLARNEPIASEQIIGGYKIISRIGAGGMGDVYLAEDIQFHRKVALKLVRAALGTDDLVARFRHEEQILASLNDPNIAHLYGGGVTANGIPFFVMEYVDGLRIDEYCSRHNLNVKARLDLFRKVCSAVHYAHQHLVVHRDLKPSNILVNAGGEPKLLDFGIAKLLSTDESVPAMTLAGIMTPDYASPEQVRCEAITTASDVYSLGVILYELLTGQSPYQLTNRNPADVARAITDQEPERPSTVVVKQRGQTAHRAVATTSNPDPRTPTTGRERAKTLGAKSLKGDLDNIALMALRKDPARRYASVWQFSEDIRRYLEDLPVLARKDSFSYRASKFISRNKAATVAASLALLTLLGGTIAIAWGARTARREQVKTQSVNAFLEQIIQYPNPQLNFSRRHQHEVTVTEAIDQAVKRLEAGTFPSDPEVTADLERIISGAYASQGRQTEAIEHAQKYLSLLQKLYHTNDPRTLGALEIRAWIQFSKGDLADAERLYREVIPLLRAEQKQGRRKVEDLIEVLNAFAYLRRTQGDSKEAEILFREVLSFGPQLSKELGYVLMVTRSTLASTLADQGKFAEALDTASTAVNEARAAGQADAPSFGFSQTILGGFLVDQGEFAKADASLLEGEKVIRNVTDTDSLWLGDNLRNQAISLYRQNRFDEAQPKIDETLRIYRLFGPHYDHYPTVLIVQGLIWNKTGKTEQAEAILREALKLRTDLLPKDHFWVAIAKGALGEFLTTQKRFSEAEPLLNESYTTLKSRLGPDDPRTREASQRLATLADSSKNL